MREKQLLIALIVLFGLSGSVLAGCTPESIFLVKDGQARVTILFPADPSPIKIKTSPAMQPARDSADFLARYISLSTGVNIPVRSDKDNRSEDGITLHVGRTRFVQQLNLKLDELGADGFTIAFPDAKNVVICGASESGTEFGVYDFLERYLGVRWLFPGDLGEHIPEHKNLKIATREIREQPAFYDRMLSGLKGEQTTWARRNRYRQRIHFHHNLLNLFAPKTYTKTHPEFFPIINGQRYLPSTTVKDKQWQPCFSAKGIVKEAVKNICEHFAENPGVTSYSLGINDTSKHCQCKNCRAKDSRRRNSVRQQDRSNSYYEWCNAVVEEVLKRYPDKYFGLLAYSGVADPPTTVKVNRHIIPYMTYERYQWLNEDIEKRGHRITKAWAKEVPALGWYDYLYGKFYPVPRVWFHKMAEYLRFGHKYHVRYYYGEAHSTPDWREGPKLYLCLKLLWDPYIDVDKTLRDWYACAVGEEAAPYLAEYFDFWEKLWTQDLPKSKWFLSEMDQQWMGASDDFLEFLGKTDLDKCEKLLRLVVTHAKTQKEKARAEFFLSSFLAWSKEVYPKLAEIPYGLAKLEQMNRLEELSNLEGGSLRMAAISYKNWLDKCPPNLTTASLYLRTAMLMEKAGEKGSWAPAFDNSPWGKSNVSWFVQLVRSLNPSILEKDTIKAGAVGLPPRIDGILDDRCWLKADTIGNFRDRAGDTITTQPTFAAIGYDKDNLYIAYLCLENNIQNLSIRAKEHDGPVWRDDCIEFFAVPEHRAREEVIYQLAISAAGVKYDSRNADAESWNPEYDVKTFIGDTFWTVEAAIPLSAFNAEEPLLGSEWKINLSRGRQERPGQIRELSAWRFTGRDNRNTSRYGVLLFQ